MITTPSRTEHIRRTVVLAATILGTLLNTPSPQAQAGVESKGCGFHHVNPDHHNGATALYAHCVDSFILIRVDASDGNHHRCVGPWGVVPFYPSMEVNYAYYVPIRPRLITASDGRQICSTTQPPV